MMTWFDKGHEAGRKAFTDGLQASPALDPAMFEILKEIEAGAKNIFDRHKSSNAMLEGWLNGWHWENLSAVVYTPRCDECGGIHPKSENCAP